METQNVVVAYEKTKLGRKGLSLSAYQAAVVKAYDADPVAAADALQELTKSHTIQVQHLYPNPRTGHRELIDARIMLSFLSPDQPPHVSLMLSRFEARGQAPSRMSKDQHPYHREFTLVGQGPSADEFNMLHAEPAWQPLERWHGANVHHGPAHYRANSVYWWQCRNVETLKWKSEGEKRIHMPSAHQSALEVERLTMDAFKRTCVFGAVPSDADFSFEKQWVDPTFDIEQWLIDRKPALMQRFYNDLQEHHLVTIDELTALLTVRL